MNADFLPQKGGFRNLIAYKLSDNIYNLTYLFAHKFLKKGDRTIDQMVQAARSCKQNIAEGSAASTTSKETEIKLTNVAGYKLTQSESRRRSSTTAVESATVDGLSDIMHRHHAPSAGQSTLAVARPEHLIENSLVERLHARLARLGFKPLEISAHIFLFCHLQYFTDK